jgi:hypothetical protein
LVLVAHLVEPALTAPLTHQQWSQKEAVPPSVQLVEQGALVEQATQPIMAAMAAMALTASEPVAVAVRADPAAMAVMAVAVCSVALAAHRRAVAVLVETKAKSA